jgi:hypothetical protein
MYTRIQCADVLDYRPGPRTQLLYIVIMVIFLITELVNDRNSLSASAPSITVIVIIIATH